MGRVPYKFAERGVGALSSDSAKEHLCVPYSDSMLQQANNWMNKNIQQSCQPTKLKS